MADLIPHRRRPCASCPWRTDTAGRLAFANLVEYADGTCGKPGSEAALGAVMFACHSSRTDPAQLCAGWLAVAGYYHLSVRLAVAWGHLPGAVLTAPAGWPALFAGYDEMTAAHERALADALETP